MKKKQNNKSQLKDEWVIKLVNAAEKSVKGYEKYLLDQMNFSELAKLKKKMMKISTLMCLMVCCGCSGIKLGPSCNSLGAVLNTFVQGTYDREVSRATYEREHPAEPTRRK